MPKRNRLGARSLLCAALAIIFASSAALPSASFEGLLLALPLATAMEAAAAGDPNGESTWLMYKGGGEATLRWEPLGYGGTASEVAARYSFIVKRKAGDGAYETVATLSGNRTYYDFTGLLDSRVYSFAVTLRDRGQNHDEQYGNEVVFAPGQAGPAPSGLAAKAVSTSEIELQWSYAGSGYETVVERRVEGSWSGSSSSEEGWETVGTARAGVNRFVDGGAVPDTRIWYRARARYGNGAFSAYTATVSLYGATDAPKIVDIYAASASSVYIEWTMSPGASRYTLERREGGIEAAGVQSDAVVAADGASEAEGGSGSGSGAGSADPGYGAGDADAGYVQVASLARDRLSYIDSAVLPGGRYTYRVKAVVSGRGESLYSDEAEATVAYAGAPRGLSAVAREEWAIGLRWTAAMPNASSYEIWRRTVAAAGASLTQGEQEWKAIGTSGRGAESYLDDGVAPGCTYAYRIKARAVIEGATSQFSNEANAATVFLDAPDRLTQTSGRGTVVSLAWRDNCQGESRFVVERRKGAAGEWAEVATAPANAGQKQGLAASADSAWFFRVGAYSASYSSVAYSDPVLADNGYALIAAGDPYGGAGQGNAQGAGGSSGSGSGSGSGSSSGAGSGSGSGAGTGSSGGSGGLAALDDVRLDREATAAIRGAGIARIASGKVVDGQSLVTRGEMAAMLVRAIEASGGAGAAGASAAAGAGSGAGSGTGAYGSFADVTASHPFYAEIMQAKAYGFALPAEGSGAGAKFYPDRAATRAEVAAFVFDSLAAIGEPMPAHGAEALEPFSDAAGVPSSVLSGSLPKFCSVLGEKVMIGIGVGGGARVAGAEIVATREQAALVSYRYMLWREARG